MTIQNLFTAEIGDILHVQLQCTCGARVALTPDEGRLPDSCPQCGAGWRTMERHFESKLLQDFIESLKKAREQQKASPRLRVGLVFDLGKQAK